jgi:hypothetical protein
MVSVIHLREVDGSRVGNPFRPNAAVRADPNSAPRIGICAGVAALQSLLANCEFHRSREIYPLQAMPRRFRLERAPEYLLKTFVGTKGIVVKPTATSVAVLIHTVGSVIAGNRRFLVRSSETLASRLPAVSPTIVARAEDPSSPAIKNTLLAT